MKEKSSIENNSKEKREIDFDNERNQFEENAQYLDDQNKKGENELYEKLFQSANTPIGDSRFPSIIMDARSPANFLVSPYPPNTWTPTIFLFDDQRQVSPQISYQNSFGSKISSNFHKFVEGENDEKE